MVRSDVLGGAHRDVRRAERAIALICGDNGRLDWWQKPRHAAQPVSDHRAAKIGLDRSKRTLRIKISVVEPIWQYREIRRKAVAANVAALPDQLRPSRRQSVGNRAATERATDVMHAVSAHQDYGVGDHGLGV